MPPPNVRPERTPEELRWTRVKLECGKTIKGWLAGPVFGVEGHATPAFKPCHSLFSNGKRACPWCAIPKLATIRYQGYAPFYDERLKRSVMCVNLDNTVRLDALPLLSPITFGKGKYPTSPIEMTGTTWTTLRPSGPTVRTVPQSVLFWLVHVLWKAEQLTDCLLDDIEPTAVVEPAAAVELAAVVQQPASSVEQLRAMMAARGFGSMKELFEPPGSPVQVEPSKNGKHKQKPR